MDNVKGCFLALIIFGVCFGLFLQGYMMWLGIAEEMVPGKHLLWLSVGVSGLFFIWQIIGFIQLYRSPKKLRFRRGITVIVGGWSIFVFVYALVLNIMAYRGGEAAKAWVATSQQGFKDLIIPDTGFYTIAFYLFYILVMAVISGVLLFCFFMLGRLGFGISLGLAIHNWANGAGLDFSAFLESFFGQLLPEITLSDFWGIIYAFLWLFISQFLLKAPETASLDAAI